MTETKTDKYIFVFISIILVVLFFALYHSTVNEYFDGESVLYAKPFPLRVVFEHFVKADWPYFRPLVLLQWKIESYFFGKDHRYYHYSLMFLNVLNIILVVFLAYELFESRLSAFIAGLIFTLNLK